MENKQKKGISLIVLVITIIVMIILAAAIILSLNGSGIIGKANEAKTSSDIANAKYVAALAKAEWDLMTDEEQEKAGDSLKKYVEDKLNAAGMKGYEVDAEGKIVEEGESTYTIYTDTAKKTAPIPNGFTVSTLPGETTIAGGLVIYEGTEPVTNVDSDSNGIIDAQETRNQFVWVPVDVPEGKTFDEIFQRTTTYRPREDITTPSSSYTEPISTACSNFDYDEGRCIDTETLSLTNDPTGEWKEEAAMRSSVEKNGGFYIARYEAGLPEGETTLTVTTSDIPVSKKGAVAWDWIPWGTSMTEIGTEGAVYRARQMYKESTSVVSTLCYSVQWDAALRFIETNVAEHEGFATNSDGKGNYGSDNLEETGYYPTNNIYDMAGNVAEWTMEADYTFARVLRGGFCLGNGSFTPASYRDLDYDYGPAAAYDNYGFRPTLYIK